MQLTAQFVEADVTSAGELDNVAGLGNSFNGETVGAQPGLDLDQAGIGDSETAPHANGRFSNLSYNRGERLRNSITSTAKSQADQL
jgi:hypothetical protein